MFRKKTKEKVIYLTFDDGPNPRITPFLLDLLDEYGWKATFFCVGDYVRKYPQIYEDILARKHKTGNHTYNHLSGFSALVDNYIENVTKAEEYIETDLFRPPYGRIRPREKNALLKKYKIIMWDVLTGDFKKSETPDKIMKRIKRFTRKGSIVVFHDNEKARNNLLAVLPRAIEYWNEEGYSYGLL